MTSATINEVLEIGNPRYEVVQLECSDGETYTSRKFNIVRIALASGNEDNDAHINCEISGKTVTVNYAGMTDQKVTLFITGYAGK